MKYIIMCGGVYQRWEAPRHLLKVHGETIVERTIRLLRSAGVRDISISSNLDGFDAFGVPVLRHENDYDAVCYNNSTGYWCSCFYFTDEPTCYIFGDVIFSPAAIRTIVDTETDDIMLFGSKPPFAKEYPKPYIEPFAFKVQDPQLLRWTVEEVKRLDRVGSFHRKPIAWEFWNVAKGGDPNAINQGYVAINDYTCDVDNPDEIEKVMQHIPKEDAMAETKKTTKKAAKKPKARKVETATYKGQTYEVLERTGDKVKLTDGLIHFWAPAKNVEA